MVSIANTEAHLEVQLASLFCHSYIGVVGILLVLNWEIIVISVEPFAPLGNNYSVVPHCKEKFMNINEIPSNRE